VPDALYQQVTDTCFDAAIGEMGLKTAEFSETLAACLPAMEGLRRAHDTGRLPLLRLPARRDDLEMLGPIAERYRQEFDDVVMLATGGSSLGGQTISALADLGYGPRPGAPRLWFMDKVDPASFEALLGKLDLKRTGFLVISKSGSTAETVFQLLVCLGIMRASVGARQIASHFTVITEPGGNPMREIARRFSLPVLDHDPKVGGRYSVLSLTGVLPAMIAGLDPVALREGAQSVIDGLMRAADAKDYSPAVGAAIATGLARHHGVAITVLMPYVDRLAHFGQWYRQLWAESLGKGGNGTTPVRAMGPLDQHSQLQLYLDGPRDKMFTLIQLKVAGLGPRVDPTFADEPALYYLADRTMGDLVEAELRATAETLARNGRPLRIFKLERLDESVLGAMLMHFMIETILCANLAGVDPFNQPAVEEGKVLTRDYLRRPDSQR
jgi:glucose-6-phosphate isomerase